jgi:hypothetical protein
MYNPNSFDEEVVDATIANPDTDSQGTETEAIDYKTKFSFSSQEAIRLKAENDRKDAIIAELEANKASYFNNSPNQEEELFPNYSDLDDEAKQNLLAYTETVKRSVREDLYKDPALAFARSNYNEKKFDDAFAQITDSYPDIKVNGAEFKAKYFNAQNVPDNIADILQDVAKIYLFDKAKEIGAEEERSKAGRLEIDVATGGEKTTSTRRSMEDWLYLSQTNPAKFASLEKEYEADSKHF